MDELAAETRTQQAASSRLKPGLRVLVLGGSRSGKSRFAERYFTPDAPVTYVATAADYPGDLEWADRVRRHRDRRPATWSTVETGNPAEVLASAGVGVPILLDSVTTWLSRVMDECACWAETPSPESAKQLAASIDALEDAWACTGAVAVVVSDEVGSGVIPESGTARRFRDELGDLNQRLAARADEVWLITAGIPLRLR